MVENVGFVGLGDRVRILLRSASYRLVLMQELAEA